MLDGLAFHTPEEINGIGARLIIAPMSFFPFLGDVINSLNVESNWHEVGITVVDAAGVGWDILERFYMDNPMIGSMSAFFDDPGDLYLPLDGQTHSEDDYPELYLVLPDSMVDEMAGEFTLPSAQGLFLKGQEAPELTGDTGGAENVTLTINQIPDHDHSYTPPVLNIDLEGPGVPDILAAGIGAPTTTGSTGGGQSHENRPPFIVVEWYIFSGRTRV